MREVGRVIMRRWRGDSRAEARRVRKMGRADVSMVGEGVGRDGRGRIRGGVARR